MSYREENGQVVLTISHEDYDALLMRLASAAAYSARCYGTASLGQHLALLNRLNEGNPKYTPYEVPDGKAS